jgi:large subunit ribosomal protein L25
MADITLVAEQRPEKGSRPSGRLRRAGRVPAVVYGLGVDTLMVTVRARELGHILSGASGANTLITLEVDGDDFLTLARQIQRHPTRGELLHVDFIRIRRDVAVSAEIPVHLVGESTGVRDGGLLEQLIFNLTIEAMPGNIPVSLEVDVSALAIGDQIRVSDVPLGNGVATQVEGETVVAQVAAPRVVTEEEGVEVEEGEEVEAASTEAAADAAEGGDGGGDGE